MSKHTPGPWRIAGCTYSERWIVDSDSPKTGKQNIIAMLQDHWKGNANGYMEANAQLIAAAPQMLEALEAVAPLLHWLDQEQNVTIAGDMLPKVLAAIKAAKGKYEKA